MLESAQGYVRFNKEKVQFKVTLVEYLGSILLHEGISPGIARAITETKQPSNKKELLCYIFVKICVKFFSQNTTSHALLKNDMYSLVLDSSSQVNIQVLKKQIATALVLRFFDISKPAVIQTDASSMGLGSYLLQDGFPIA